MNERSPRVGDQLGLELVDPAKGRSEPWGGRSPRSLTRAFEMFSLGAHPARVLRGVKTCKANKAELHTDELELFSRGGFNG